jgi:hypothetical protein
MTTNNFAGPARPITANDVAAQAVFYNIELAALRAVMAVESRNSGYDSKRRPIILFEPHVFWRNLSGAQRDKAVRLGLAYRSWGQQPYPAGSDAQYKRLAEAIKINEESAYRSISIGLGQILGENYKAAGCDSARQMFEQAAVSETNQLKHLLGFIIAKGLRDDLNRHDWRGFAAVYNGRGQVEKYSKWLEREYEKWRRIVSKPRRDLDVQDLRDAGSKTIASADTAKTAIAVASVAGPTAGVALDAIQTGLEPVTRAIQTAQQAQSAWEWVSENWQFLAVVALTLGFLAACFFAWRAMRMVEQERVQNARDGLNTRI